MFRFANIDYLYLLLLIPILVGIYIYARMARRKQLERFGKPVTVDTLMPEVSTHRITYKFIFFLSTLVCLIFALARPQFGSKLKEVEREGVEIMLAVDVSNSMLAEDFEPNRLERTKYAIGRLLDGLKEDKIGLIVFAGDAYVQLPITSDYLTARNFVQQISPNIVSKQGTAIGTAISLATSSFSSQSNRSRVMILITDGENHEDDALAAARHAASQGVKIYTIGIGTPEGAPIQIDNDFIRDDKGEIVVSKLDEDILEKIALTTDGAYIRSTAASMGLQEIVDKVNQTEKAQFKTKVYEEYNEQYQYPLLAALILLLLEQIILPRKNRLLARFNIFGRKNRNAE